MELLGRTHLEKRVNNENKKLTVDELTGLEHSDRIHIKEEPHQQAVSRLTHDDTTTDRHVVYEGNILNDYSVQAPTPEAFDLID